MTHEQFSNLISAYLQGQLEQADRAAMDAHQAACPDCRLALQIRRDGLSLDSDSEAPTSFTGGWRLAVQQKEASNMEDKQAPKPIGGRFQFRRWMAVAAALVLVVGGTLLSKDSLGRRNAAVNMDYAQEEQADYGGFAPSGMPAPQTSFMTRESAPAMDMAMQAKDNAPAEEVKIIRTVSLGLSTRDFDEDLKRLNEAVTAVGGYVEYSDVSLASGSRRTASITARIPREKLDDFLKQAQTYGRLSSMSESQEDVSESYRDVDTRFKTQTAKMSRLQDLLGRATTVEDILSIENEIANTQYQIDSLTGSLKGMDSRVSYSSVRISLQEQTLPSVPEPQNLWERVKLAVSDAWQQSRAFLGDMLIFLAVILPYLIVIAIVVYLIRLIVKRRKK